MATKHQLFQRIIRDYRIETGETDVDMHKVAFAVKKKGVKLPTPLDPLDMLAKDFSSAAREEIRYDGRTKRPYRAQHCYPVTKADGKQGRLWIDIDGDAPRPKMVRSVGRRPDRGSKTGGEVDARRAVRHRARGGHGAVEKELARLLVLVRRLILPPLDLVREVHVCGDRLFVGVDRVPVLHVETELNAIADHLLAPRRLLGPAFFLALNVSSTSPEMMSINCFAAWFGSRGRFGPGGMAF